MSKVINPDEFIDNAQYSVSQLAELTGLNRTTIYRKINQGLRARNHRNGGTTFITGRDARIFFCSAY